MGKRDNGGAGVGTVDGVGDGLGVGNIVGSGVTVNTRAPH